MEDREEQIRRLLRLKRYEHPGEDYFAHFLDEFHARQQKREPVSWLRRVEERLNHLFEEQRWAWPSLAGAALVLLLLVYQPIKNGKKAALETSAAADPIRRAVMDDQTLAKSSDPSSVPFFPEKRLPFEGMGFRVSPAGYAAGISAQPALLRHRARQEAFRLRSPEYQQPPEESKIRVSTLGPAAQPAQDDTMLIKW